MIRAFWSGFTRTASRSGLTVCLSLILSGCATYEAHYSRFEAVNSSGEPRTFLLSWQTERYPGWAMRKDVATAVTLQTQCSERKWSLRDKSNGACDVKRDTTGQEPTAGIRACGEPGADLDRRGQPIAEPGHQCLTLTDSADSQRILDLDNNVHLTVACYPAVTERGEGEEVINTDYLKASAVPYNLHVRSAPLYSMSARPPKLDEKVCDEE